MTTIALQETTLAPNPEHASYAYYDRWIESLNLPIYTGYYVEDLRTLKLGRWEQRGCDAAFLQLAGQQGVTGAYVTEIAPGATTPPFRLALDECVYVLQGRGITTIKGNDTSATKSFEWQSHSMFLVPGNYSYQLSNTTGNQPAKLLHTSYLPLAMQVIPNTEYFFNNPVVDLDKVYGHGGEYYSEAKALDRPSAGGRVAQTWSGNFFPDMRAWDKLVAFKGRGAGGTVVFVEFPGSPMTAHMSVFPPRSYKKGHRHGPAFVIVIPAGEGYSIMWQDERSEKVVVPWHEASCFVPPFRWFHQHFNVSTSPDRYLAIHPPRGLAGSGERVEDRSRDQIEYDEEDPFIRQKFEDELSKRGLSSVMPEDCYRIHDYKWENEKV
jgi:hypothetical protein